MGWFGPTSGDCRCDCPVPNPCDCSGDTAERTYSLVLEVEFYSDTVDLYYPDTCDLDCAKTEALTSLPSGTFFLTSIKRTCVDGSAVFTDLNPSDPDPEVDAGSWQPMEYDCNGDPLPDPSDPIPAVINYTRSGKFAVWSTPLDWLFAELVELTCNEEDVVGRILLGKENTLDSDCSPREPDYQIGEIRLRLI
jgi:hypothetical protein